MTSLEFSGDGASDAKFQMLGNCGVIRFRAGWPALVGERQKVYVTAVGRETGPYKAAQEGKVQAFTDIDDPYEPPEHPDVECRPMDGVS